jgi:hypothetical protein
MLALDNKLPCNVVRAIVRQLSPITGASACKSRACIPRVNVPLEVLGPLRAYDIRYLC